MADCRIKDITRELDSLEGHIDLLRKCMEVTDMLVSIREDKTVVDIFNDPFRNEFNTHIGHIIHDLDQVAYTAQYEIDYALGNVRLSLSKLDE